MKTIEVTCECPKSDITSMTEAFFGLKPGTLSKTPPEKEEEDESNADYIPGYDDGEAEPSKEETDFD